METPKLYRWTWEWSDYEDVIISSQQKFTTQALCQLDALRHYPHIREAERNGRTGTPEFRITEEDVQESRWILVFYDDQDLETGRYTEDVWYDSMAECIHASKKVNVDTAAAGSYSEVDFETRFKYR